MPPIILTAISKRTRPKRAPRRRSTPFSRRLGNSLHPTHISNKFRGYDVGFLDLTCREQKVMTWNRDFIQHGKDALLVRAATALAKMPQYKTDAWAWVTGEDRTDRTDRTDSTSKYVLCLPKVSGTESLPSSQRRTPWARIEGHSIQAVEPRTMADFFRRTFQQTSPSRAVHRRL
ncbi:hypothetical protein EG329_004062 [Mollisiaceae sp. DMI_Dod_QoI]|nr:hypothetical protein EG329_004062 [Helotiales sp. DMI_Dod_QoI]